MGHQSRRSVESSTFPSTRLIVTCTVPTPAAERKLQRLFPARLKIVPPKNLAAASRILRDLRSTASNPCHLLLVGRDAINLFYPKLPVLCFRELWGSSGVVCDKAQVVSFLNFSGFFDALTVWGYPSVNQRGDLSRTMKGSPTLAPFLDALTRAIER